MPPGSLLGRIFLYNQLMTTPPIIDYEGSDYQQSFWEEGGRAYEDAAEAIALQRLLPKQGRHLLELGAGAGRNTPRYMGYQNITLVDYSFTQLQQAHQRLGESGRYTYVAADIYKLPFVDGLFDGATMIRTLHHMADALQALQEVRRVLEPEAWFILEFANKRNLKAMLRYLVKKQDWSPYQPEQVEFEKLNFDFHPKTVLRSLKESGFRNHKVLSVSHFRLGLLKRSLPAAFLAKLDGVIQPTGAWWQLSPSVFTLNQAGSDGPLATAGAFFQCPACRHAPLLPEAEGLGCEACGRKYAKRDGIYDLRLLDEAKPADSAE